MKSLQTRNKARSKTKDKHQKESRILSACFLIAIVFLKNNIDVISKS